MSQGLGRCAPGKEFPAQFVWGAAAAAYQVEGGHDRGGKGPSVWDSFCRLPKKVYGGHTGEVAADHYQRFEADVALMREMGLKAYRFSISWPRVVPEGRGAASQSGIEFYSRLVDALLKAGITPWCTLFHWDYPLALFRRGGWQSPDSPEWFADYAATVARALGDRVKHWITLNEPQVFLGSGHQDGAHAPGLTLPFREVLQAGHHVLLAHGRAVQGIRAQVRDARVGFAPTATPSAYPQSDSPADIEAARNWLFGVRTRSCWTNSWWLDPVLLGHYPEDGLELYGADAPNISDGDFRTIAQPLDFLGLNVYFGLPIRAGAEGPEECTLLPGHAQTAMGWPVTPEALRWVPRLFHERYGLPIVITENGMSSRDWVATDGSVPDGQRLDFIRRYLRALRRALADGADIQGYFHWSVMDNFEWAEGYKERFGLAFVDYQTQERTLKDSALFYRRVIQTNGAELGDDPPGG